MIEGGSAVNASALASGITDKVFLYYAPKIFGNSAIPFAAGRESVNAEDASRLKHVRFHRFGEDFAVEGYLRDPYPD
jgi:diaminohydroxyphosphoribosylaminopyrimidine deaminase / 5-amino-6-(5-phosphoribosylamino)uracil reductase